MKLPDGMVFMYYPDRKGIKINIESVELIKCKHCNHYDDGLCRRWIYAHVTNEDSFCSGAERKEE